MRKYLFRFVLIFFSVLLLLIGQSCATILGGKNNSLVLHCETPVSSGIYIDGVYAGEAPGKIKIEKEVIQHGSILEIKTEGYTTRKYLILRKQNPYYSLADILTGGIPLAIDYATGNIYRPFPRKITYTLEKQ